jgi:hypothetical protein
MADTVVAFVHRPLLVPQDLVLVNAGEETVRTEGGHREGLITSLEYPIVVEARHSTDDAHDDGYDYDYYDPCAGGGLPPLVGHVVIVNQVVLVVVAVGHLLADLHYLVLLERSRDAGGK